MKCIKPDPPPKKKKNHEAIPHGHKYRSKTGAATQPLGQGHHSGEGDSSHPHGCGWDLTFAGSGGWVEVGVRVLAGGGLKEGV